MSSSKVQPHSAEAHPVSSVSLLCASRVLCQHVLHCLHVFVWDSAPETERAEMTEILNIFFNEQRRCCQVGGRGCILTLRQSDPRVRTTGRKSHDTLKTQSVRVCVQSADKQRGSKKQGWLGEGAESVLCTLVFFSLTQVSADITGTAPGVDYNIKTTARVWRMETNLEQIKERIVFCNIFEFYAKYIFLLSAQVN